MDSIPETGGTPAPTRSSAIPTRIATLAVLAAAALSSGTLRGQTAGAASDPTPAQASPPVVLSLDSRVWVEGTSTVQDFACEAGVVAATIRPTGVGNPLAIEGLEDAVRRVSLQIPAGQLDCDNDTMNEHMWKALKVERNPDIRFEMKNYRVTDRSGRTAMLEISGDLTMAGVTRPHPLTAEAAEQEDGSLRVTGSSRFQMTGFEMKPPSLMFGVLKVHDPVVVKFDLVLTIMESSR